jgi:hypothetical protein
MTLKFVKVSASNKCQDVSCRLCLINLLVGEKRRDGDEQPGRISFSLGTGPSWLRSCLGKGQVIYEKCRVLLQTGNTRSEIHFNKLLGHFDEV